MKPKNSDSSSKVAIKCIKNSDSSSKVAKKCINDFMSPAVFHGYNSLRDVKEIEDGLSVDINDMLRTGIVKDSSATLDNNGIDDPNQIIGMVRDEFAAIDAMRAIRKYGRKKASSKAESAAESAAAVAAPAPSND